MWLIPCEMEPAVIKLGQVWTKIIFKIENVRAWKPLWRVLDYENDSTRGLPYQDTVHQALNICLIQSYGLMNLVQTHSEQFKMKNWYIFFCKINENCRNWFWEALSDVKFNKMILEQHLWKESWQNILNRNCATLQQPDS